MGIPPDELPAQPAANGGQELEADAEAVPDQLTNGAYVPWHRVINSRGVISARGSVSDPLFVSPLRIMMIEHEYLAGTSCEKAS